MTKNGPCPHVTYNVWPAWPGLPALLSGPYSLGCPGPMCVSPSGASWSFSVTSLFWRRARGHEPSPDTPSSDIHATSQRKAISVTVSVGLELSKYSNPPLVTVLFFLHWCKNTITFSSKLKITVKNTWELGGLGQVSEMSQRWEHSMLILGTTAHGGAGPASCLPAPTLCPHPCRTKLSWVSPTATVPTVAWHKPRWLPLWWLCDASLPLLCTSMCIPC